MSDEEETSSWCCISCCASCSIAAVDDIELNECDSCDLVQYCSDACRELHRPEHEEACKKRAAELRDELLFKQPESSHWGDCPICCLPMPLDASKSTMFECCGKTMCNGCLRANLVREDEMRLQHKCPFCRKPRASAAESDKRIMKRIEANDAVAMRQKGREEYIEGNYDSAYDYFAKAAELGDTDAHNKLALLYHIGHGVKKDKEKELHHSEEAAIAGHPEARYHLGYVVWVTGNRGRAVKHWIIAAKQGEDKAIKMLMKAFKEGCVEKEILAATLRAHKAAVDATKSPQREEAEEDERLVLAKEWQMSKKRERPPLNNAERQID